MCDQLAEPKLQTDKPISFSLMTLILRSELEQLVWRAEPLTITDFKILQEVVDISIHRPVSQPVSHYTLKNAAKMWKVSVQLICCLQHANCRAYLVRAPPQFPGSA